MAYSVFDLYQHRPQLSLIIVFAAGMKEAWISGYLHMGESFQINPEFRILRLTSIESQPQNPELGRL